MIDKKLLQELDTRGIIDKNAVLWWQLGFEGRRIYSEREFYDTMQEVTYTVKFDEQGKQLPSPTEKTFKVWSGNDVPIFIKEYEIDGIQIPCLVSVKPLSHDRWGLDRSQLMAPISLYEQPHIRGFVLDITDRHVFWSPFRFGTTPNNYETKAVFLPKEDMWCFVYPIHPTKFYKNLNKRWSSGRNAQKKETKVDDSSYYAVPYFEFDVTQRHLTLYPSTLIGGKLDFPIVLKSKPAQGTAEILGIGQIYFDVLAAVTYKPIPRLKIDRARENLEQRLCIKIE